MLNLPKWRLTNLYPAFLDSESGTTIEQTAKVYGAMRELIEDYNKFTEAIETKINNFTATTEKDNEVFATALRQEFQDFIDTVDMKLTNLQNDISGAIGEVMDDIIESGRIAVEPVLDETTEELEYKLVVKEV